MPGPPAVRPLGVLLTVVQVASGLLALAGVVAIVVGLVEGDPLAAQARRAIALVVLVAIGAGCVVLDRRRWGRRRGPGP